MLLRILHDNDNIVNIINPSQQLSVEKNKNRTLSLFSIDECETLHLQVKSKVKNNKYRFFKKGWFNEFKILILSLDCSVELQDFYINLNANDNSEIEIIIKKDNIDNGVNGNITKYICDITKRKKITVYKNYTEYNYKSLLTRIILTMALNQIFWMIFIGFEIYMMVFHPELCSPGIWYWGIIIGIVFIIFIINSFKYYFSVKKTLRFLQQ